MDIQDPSNRTTVGPERVAGPDSEVTEVVDSAKFTTQFEATDGEGSVTSASDGETTCEGLIPIEARGPSALSPSTSISAEEFLADLTMLEATAESEIVSLAQRSGGDDDEPRDDVSRMATTLVLKRVMTRRQAQEVLANRQRSWALGSYSLQRKLGQGGMGVVYEAFDRSRNAIVALKILRKVNTASLHRFKKEFRAHAGLSHPNLIKLYELFSWDGRWFFTMERVRGVDFFAGVRGAAARNAEAAATSLDFEKVRQLFGQLANGMMAIHAAGLLHRDIKASNVLVRSDGRVVILDFGLVTDLSSPSSQDTCDVPFSGTSGTQSGETDRRIVGTIDYMSPEQASGQVLSAASDWYSVGVLLYRVLAGRVPFDVPALEVLRIKQLFDPPEPRVFNACVPQDLNDLCMSLMDRRPEFRPTGPNVLDWLNLCRSHKHGVATVAPQSQSAPAMVGRKSQLKRLAEAYEETKGGMATAVFISGPSGAGKSTLMAHFLKTLPTEGEALILYGRCFEQESVPFKAVDEIAEALARYLRSLAPGDSDGLVPESAGTLPHIFPALDRVDAIEHLRRGQPAIHDPQEKRRKAFTAFRELIAQIAARHVVILAIDDLQWGDLDSALLLAELLIASNPPRILLLGTYRNDFSEAGACMKTLRAVLGTAGSGRAFYELDIAPLDDDDARELASEAIGGIGRNLEQLIAAIVHESRGDPYAIVELARQAKAERCATGDDGSCKVDLGDVIWSRIDCLPDGSRRLLDVIALAGRPLSQRCAYRAAGLGDDAWEALMGLRDQKLAISNGLQPDDEVVTSHDRVRETIVGGMAVEPKKQVHRRLAVALEASGMADPETLAAHFVGGDEPYWAAAYYEAAADRAAGKLAFDRAAKLYDVAAVLRPLNGEPGTAFRTKHAEALANAGRSGEAGAAYFLLAEEARQTGREAGGLLRRSAYQYMIGGRIDDGRSLWRTVLSDKGIALPDSPGKAIRSLIVESARLKIRGLRFRLSENSFASPEILDRIDLLWSAGTALSMIDPIAAHVFRLKGLRTALGSGDPKRIAFGLASYATILSYSGTSKSRQVARLRQQAEELARRCGDPHTLAMHSFMGGFIDFHFMRLKAARRQFEEAEAIFSSQCRDVTWESDTCRLMKMWTNVLLCELDSAVSDWELHRHSAFDRGNLYAQYTLEVIVGPGIRIARDEPEEARRWMRNVMAHWSGERFLLQHFNLIETEARIDRYVGDGRSSLDRLEREWKMLRRSMAFRSQLSRTVLIFSRSLAAVMVAQTSRRPRALLDLASRGAQALFRERWPYADAYAESIVGAVLSAKRQEEAAVDHFTRSKLFWEANDMKATAACAERRIGELRGGDEGSARVAEADATLRALKIKDPVKFARIMMA